MQARSTPASPGSKLQTGHTGSGSKPGPAHPSSDRPEAHLEKEDVLREPLDGLEEEALQTEAGLAALVLLLQEVDKLGLLLDGSFQHHHGICEVVHVFAVAVDHLLPAELCAYVRGGIGG